MAFIVFEGLDASGKSTQIQRLDLVLKQRGINTVLTREPGGTVLGEELRALVLKNSGDAPVAKAELLIYEASRAQHVGKVIQPALSKGKWVLCDRFAASSVAFQSAGRKLKPADIHWLNQYATGGIMPNLTVLLDITVEESERRKGQRLLEFGQESDRMEREKREFHQSIRDSYLEQARDPSWLVVSGLDEVDVVFAKIWQRIESERWLES